MSYRVWSFLVAVWLNLTVVSAGIARERPELGLALSGGGAKGFAHIGVLKVLEEIDMPVDRIAGTSVGSIVGGLYSVGYTAAELESIVVHTDWLDLFSDRVSRRLLAMEQKRWDSRYIVSLAFENLRIQLPSGLSAGQQITRLLSHLTLPVHHISNFEDLPIPFSCVGTNFVTGEAVPLEGGDLTESIRASMAIPSVFTPITIDGRLLVDGGLARNLPAEDVRRRGADIVIGVDVSSPAHDAEELRSLPNVLEQTVILYTMKSTREQRRLCDILILPDIAEFRTVDFDKAALIIERGEEAARDMLPRLQALADSLNHLSRPREKRRRPREESVHVTGMTTEGLVDVDRRLVETELDITYPRWMGAQDLERGIDRLYRTDYFERVSYRIERAEVGSNLKIKAVEKTDDLFRIGLRYDSRSDAALLLNTTFRNLGRITSTIALDLVLGQDFEFDGRYLIHSGLLRAAGARLRTNVSRISRDFFEGEERVARFRTTYSLGEVFLGTIFATGVSVGAGLRAEYIESETSIGSLQVPDRHETFFPLFGILQVDTFDRTVFPTSGLFVQWVSEVTRDRFGSDTSIDRHYLDWRAIIPIHPRTSILQNLYLGTSSSGEVTPVYQFALGGVNTPSTFLGEDMAFLGLKHQERVGDHVQAFQLGLQYHIPPAWYVQLRWNVGNTFDEWKLDLDGSRFIHGGGITIGLDSYLGPVEVTAMTSERHDFLTHVSLGYKF